MRTLDLRNDTTADIPAELERLEARLRRDRPDLPPPLVMPWSDVCVIALDGGQPWLYGPVERDPMALGGRTVLPRRERHRLARVDGRPFRRIAIAHQLDADGPVAGLMPVLRHGPRLCTDAVARAVVGSVPPPPGTVRTLQLLDGVLRGSGRTVALVAERLLDPIVFGIAAPAKPVHGEACLWYALAAWRW